MGLVASSSIYPGQAVVHLRPVVTPLGVGVLADGRPRHRLVATVSGLPEPGTLGNFSTYVA